MPSLVTRPGRWGGGGRRRCLTGGRNRRSAGAAGPLRQGLADNAIRLVRERATLFGLSIYFGYSFPRH